MDIRIRVERVKRTDEVDDGDATDNEGDDNIATYTGDEHGDETDHR